MKDKKAIQQNGTAMAVQSRKKEEGFDHCAGNRSASRGVHRHGGT